MKLYAYDFFEILHADGDAFVLFRDSHAFLLFSSGFLPSGFLRASPLSYFTLFSKLTA